VGYVREVPIAFCLLPTTSHCICNLKLSRKDVDIGTSADFLEALPEWPIGCLVIRFYRAQEHKCVPTNGWAVAWHVVFGFNHVNRRASPNIQCFEWGFCLEV